jgi:hypothetical protein
MKATSPAYYGHQKHPPHNAYNGLLFELLRLEKDTGRFSHNWIGVTNWCHCYICTYGLRKEGPIILAALIPHHINLLITESNFVDYKGILCSKITITLTGHISTDMKPASLNRTSVGSVFPSDIAQNYQ